MHLASINHVQMVLVTLSIKKVNDVEEDARPASHGVDVHVASARLMIWIQKLLHVGRGQIVHNSYLLSRMAMCGRSQSNLTGQIREHQRGLARKTERAKSIKTYY